MRNRKLRLHLYINPALHEIFPFAIAESLRGLYVGILILMHINEDFVLKFLRDSVC